MTQIIESEIAKILALAALLAKGTLVTGENGQAAAQNYRSADECAERRFAQLQAIAARQDSNGSQPPRTLTELLISTTDRTE